MAWYRTLTSFSTAIVAFSAQWMSGNAQTAQPTAQVPSISVSLAMEKDHVPIGQKPPILLTIKNISQRVIGIPGNLAYRIHVEGKSGVPPETEYQRHRHGDFRPGDGPDLAIGPSVTYDIEVGTPKTETLDLTLFYDLSKPGKYRTYIEFYDPLGPREGSRIWVRSNTLQFEIVPQRVPIADTDE